MHQNFLKNTELEDLRDESLLSKKKKKNDCLRASISYGLRNTRAID